MAVTLDAINIETITDIDEIQAPRLSQTQIGVHALPLVQHMKGTLHQYQVTGVWSDAPNDYTNKKRKIQNMVDGGLPVWFDAQDWASNQIIYGKVSDFRSKLSEGKVNVYDFSFLITGVFPWGYCFVQEDGSGDFRIYDMDKFVQSRVLNPLLRRCNVVKGTTSMTFSFFVKNIGASSGALVVEMMLPNGLGTGAVLITSSGGAVTKAVGDIGAGGISTTPGTKRRITFTRTIGNGVEEQWDVTINFGASTKTSFLDGSIDEQAA